MAFFLKTSPAMNVVVFSGPEAVRSERGGRLLLLGPRTAVAVVPAGDVAINWLFTERARDDQEVVVQGDLVVRLAAARVVARRNFTLNTRTRTWEDPRALEGLSDDFRRQLRGFLRSEVRRRNLRENLTDLDGIEGAVRTALGAESARQELEALGGALIGCFLTSIAPANAKLKEALEAEEREKLLSGADRALHERRQQNAERERAIQIYEADTALQMERERVRLVEQQAKNLELQARGEAEATRIKLEPFERMAPGMVLSHAVLETARAGKIANLHLSPDVVGALQGAIGSGA